MPNKHRHKPSIEVRKYGLQFELVADDREGTNLTVWLCGEEAEVSDRVMAEFENTFRERMNEPDDHAYDSWKDSQLEEKVS